MESSGVLPIGYLEDLLRRPDGTVMDRRVALREFGYRALWLAALNSAVRDELSDHTVRGYPPRIFLSYRWGTAETNAWVAEAAGRLRDRGYDVVFDQYFEWDGDHMSIPRFIGRIAGSETVAIVVTEGYCDVTENTTDETGRSPDGWVRDEHRLALRLAGDGLAQLVGLLRQGDRLPTGLSGANMHDLRGPAWREAFDAAFPVYDGPTLTSSARAELTALLERAERRIADGDDSGAAALLDAHREYDWYPGWWFLYGLAAVDVGPPTRVADLAERLENETQPAWRWRAAELWRRLGDQRRALALVAPMLRGGFEAAKVHFLIGSIHETFENGDPAINHFRRVTQLDPDNVAAWNDAGLLLRSALRLEEAEEYLRRALSLRPELAGTRSELIITLAGLGRLDDALRECDVAIALDPDNEAFHRLRRAVLGGVQPAVLPRRDVTTRCASCEADFAVGPGQWLCGDCGTVYDAAQPGCPICGNEAVVFTHLVTPSPGAILCPVCRKGPLVAGR